MLETVRWKALGPAGPLPGKVRLIDQTKLPETLEFLETDKLEEIFKAIQRLVVRGAPAIGIAAAFGLAAAAQHSRADTAEAFLAETKKQADYLAGSRPTAVNLFWALDRCLNRVQAEAAKPVAELKLALWREAQNILDEDIAMCRRIGQHGLELLRAGVSVLTHCNAGALATGDYGTALAPIYAAHEAGLKPKVYADETRPLLQGSRLTAWELERAGIDVTVICDNMAAALMAEGKIDLVIVGADRIAANGDTANKIGTYGVAVLAHYHQLPFYVAAPYSTVDLSLASGTEIPIEQRAPEEVSCGFGKRTAPVSVAIYNPAFDVTPAKLISAIVTDQGIISPPYGENLAKILGKQF